MESSGFGSNLKTQSANPLFKADEKRLRKKLQNRLNQRARRSRVHAAAFDHNSGKQPYQVYRWRALNSNEPVQTKEKAHKISKLDLVDLDSNVQTASLTKYKPLASEQLHIFPYADQLLHLIQHNVFRALLTNKFILGRKAMTILPNNVPEPFETSWPSFSVVMPTSTDLPDSLVPTQSQMSIFHSVWINMIPFPQMRENLIHWEGTFLHWDFVSDIIGNILDASLFAQPRNYISNTGSNAGDLNVISKANWDENASDRNGLVVWGEPYLPENWEATPGFLRKWAWAMQGCHELIVSTNHWRSIRGEEKLSFPLL